MYARISQALAVRANGVATAYITVPPPSASIAKSAETSYRMGCGTLTTATWPPTSAPVIVTATSVAMQQQQQRPSSSPPRSLYSSPTVFASSVDETSAHPRHPLPMVVSRSPMWYAATTRSQRGYALGRSTLNFTTKSFASAPAAAGDEASTTPRTAANGESSGEASSGVSASPSTTEARATGTVMLPDAMVFSFKGNPHEFQDRLRGANVLVFFYKAVCGPCAVIRSKLIHAVSEHLSMDASTFLHGNNSNRGAPAPPQSEGTQQQQQPEGSSSLGDAEPSTSSSPPSPSPSLSGEGHAAVAESTVEETAMGAEDKEACAFACRTLEDVAKAYPHRMIFLTVDTNENVKLTALHDIRSLPTFIAYRNGRMVGRVEGADEQEVRRLVQSITTEEAAAEQVDQLPRDAVEEETTRSA